MYLNFLSIEEDKLAQLRKPYPTEDLKKPEGPNQKYEQWTSPNHSTSSVYLIIIMCLRFFFPLFT